MTGVAGASVLGVTVPTGSVDYSFRLYGDETTRHPTKSLARFQTERTVESERSARP